MVARVALVAGILIILLGGAAAFLLRPDLSLSDIKARDDNLVLSESSAFLPVGEGHAVHIRDQGKREGTTLVLLHDADSSLHTFEPWSASLGKQYRVVSLDLPGHGLTGPIPGVDENASAMVPLLDKVANALGLERFALAGNGLGGDLALRYALTHPERVTHLVLIAPQGMPETRAIAGGTPLLVRIAHLPLVGGLARFANLKSYVRAALKRDFFDDARVHEDMVARQWLLLRREGNRQALLTRLSHRAVDAFTDELDTIAKPVLLLWGAEDEVAPVGEAARYQGAMPQAALIVFENVGHFVQEEAADDSAGVVNSFLLGQPVGSAESARALRRVYGEVPPLPPAPIVPVEIAPLGPARKPAKEPAPEPVRLPSP